MRRHLLGNKNLKTCFANPLETFASILHYLKRLESVCMRETHEAGGTVSLTGLLAEHVSSVFSKLLWS